MRIDEAHKIIQIWGSHLEYCQDKLEAVFLRTIPKSLLPYPLEVIEEALDMEAKIYFDSGDYGKSELLKESSRCLASYVDDEVALQVAAMAFNKPEVKDKVISNMKNVQDEWIKAQD